MAETMTADQAMFLRNLYLGTLKNESRTTKSILESVPTDKADYRPDPISKTANELVRHIAAADNRFVETVINGSFDASPSMIPEDAKSPSEVASWYEQRYAKNFEALANASPEQLTKIVDFRGLFQRPAVTFLIFGLNHTIHHRGQLSAYFRLNDVTHPPIYGPNAEMSGR